MWRAPLDKNLCAAEKYMKERFPGVCAETDGKGGLEFLEYTTLSFREISDGRFELPTLTEEHIPVCVRHGG